MRTLRSLLYWAPAALWYSLIWRLSAQPGDISGSVSAGVIEDVLISGGSDYSAVSSHVQLAVDWLLSMYIRKAAHMFLFFMLALLIWLALTRLLNSRPHRAAATALLCTVLAALDELHQTLVPGRTGKLTDVLVDAAGIVIALSLFALPWLTRQAGRRLQRPERIWLFGAFGSAALLIRIGTLEGIAPIFVRRAAQLEFFTWMDEASLSALLAACAPILRQALYLAACAVTGFACVLPAILSENRRCMYTALSAALLLCILTALLWSLPLVPGALLAVAAGAAALVLHRAFPLLRR